MISYFFFFNDTATTEIYTLSLHDALPIFIAARHVHLDVAEAPFREVRLERGQHRGPGRRLHRAGGEDHPSRSEEHTSELQSPCNLVCRLLLEKKKKKEQQHTRIDRAWYLH